MSRSDVRTADSWRSFDRTALLIALSLACFLFAVWLFNLGPLSANDCCEKPVSLQSQALIEQSGNDDLAVLEAIPLLPFFFSLQREGDRLFMSGKVASEAERQQLLAAVKSHFGDLPLATTMVVEDGVMPINIALLDNLLEEIATVRNLLVTYSPEQWLVNGDVAVDSQLRRLSDLLASLADTGQLRLKNNLAVLAAEDNSQAYQHNWETCDTALATAKIEFAAGSYELTSAGKSAIHNILYCLSAGNYQIVGHADATSNANPSLAQARAQSVQNYLVHLGVNPARLMVAGDTASEPMTTDSNAGLAQNRRVEFKRTQ